MFEKRLANFSIVAAAAVFAVCVTVIASGGMRRPDTHIAQLGSVAPEITFRDVNNQDLKLSSLRGSFVLVYFTPDPVFTPVSTPVFTPVFTPGDAMKPAPASDAVAEPLATAATVADAKLSQLNQLSDALNAKRVMVLEGEQSPSEQPMNLFGMSVDSAANVTAIALGDASNRYSRMLLDADGEIARNYRVDAISAQPTLFVIDDRGVIRYRGSFEQASAENLVHKLAAVGVAKQFSVAPVSVAPAGAVLEPLAALNRF